MSIEAFALGGVALALVVVLYLRHSHKRADANMDRLKEEAEAAILKEQERLAQKKVKDRRQ